jgi:type I restriction enzyme S subunit
MEHVEAHTMRLVGTAPAVEMKSSAIHFLPDDLLYGRLRPYLNKVYRPDFEGLCSAEFIVLPGNPQIETRYLQYFVNSAEFVSFASHLNEGDRPRVDFGQIADYSTPLPPLFEQRRIVAAIEEQLTRLDAAVAALTRVLVNLKHYRASILMAAYDGRLTHNERELARSERRSYEDASILVARILRKRRDLWERARQTSIEVMKWNTSLVPLVAGYPEPTMPEPNTLPTLPVGWAWATAEQLSDETRPITYGVIKLGAPTADGVPTLRSSDVRHLRLDLTSVKRISPQIASNYKRTILRGEEILVTVRGTLGGVAVAPKSCAGANISREVAMIALVEESMAKLVALLVASNQSQRWLMARARGIAYVGVNIATLKELPLPIPPLSEQNRIAAEVERRLSLADDLEALVKINLKRAERLRQSILKRAFEGKLVPQDPNDEPASTLLERIKAEREAQIQDAARKTAARRRHKFGKGEPPEASSRTK